MATSNTSFRIAELDFDTIKLNLRNYLRSQNQFQDYDFEGAGLNILLDILAYNTHYMAYYLNMVGNEMFLDSALIRNSIISHAKHLNYTPTSRRAATAEVSILVTPPSGNTLSTLTLPKYTEFQSEAIDGVNYTFVTTEAYVSTKNLTSNTFTFSGVELKQGERLSYDFAVTENNPTRNFVIPSANIDTTTLTVEVQTSTLDTSSNVFVQVSDITTINANSKVYFLSAVENEQYSMYFGDNYLGKGLSNGNIILTDYVVTDADLGNKANVFTIMGEVGGFSNVIVNSVAAASGGAERETTEQIKFRAPIAYTYQNRAVTTTDYLNLLARDYPAVDQISVWGGQDNDPVVYGKVFISMKPKAGYVITNAEKNRITNEIITNLNVVTVTPELIDPEYTYILTKAKIYYDQSSTNLTAPEIQTLVRNTIVSYASTELNKFNEPFKFSRLQTAIDNADPSITNSDLSITLQKRFTPSLNESLNYEITFNAPLQRGGVFDKLSSFPSFTILDSNGITRTAYIEEVPLSYTGVESVAMVASGSNYTEAPTVTISGDGSGATARASIVNGKVISVKILTRGSNYTRATVSFESDSGSGASAEAVLSARYGTLRVFYYKDNGEKIIINSDIGTIDYEVGKINLVGFKPTTITSNPYYTDGVLVFNIGSEEQRIEPTRNRILTLDTTDSLSIQIDVEAV
jgi:hypothetical protein